MSSNSAKVASYAEIGYEVFYEEAGITKLVYTFHSQQQMHFVTVMEGKVTDKVMLSGKEFRQFSKQWKRKGV